ncbi:nucleosomal histone kinase 1 [Drosophila guanche]|uniref:non-specific serine/threonine protein kinase n=1 Tax=Drosophila guanche TaxID=7266 RepID=A0A3B0JFD8_DROGU|nr:nucleosomal histone kinase 1 [Drosophila guanche]SPP81104.1 blast:Nucleosomal histone kinase 1 [Drosophila guanche]
MPRAVKPKAAAGSAPAKKAKGKLYAMPEKLVEGTVLQDLAKGQWRIGPSIGIGGFGEIYAAARVGEKNYDAVVKCEPHGNGPLFVEMHFYLRNAKQDDIKQFKQKRGLKTLGMPYILASGSADVNGQKHRFIVMPRYGSDISKFFNENDKRLPDGTVYRLALQMLDVYQFMHSTGYVHADLKAANILLGMGKAGASQAYLVDFGLASHFVTGDFKPDPKKMHNGTIEYTSRDAHLGVPTRRADLEILGYNIIEWLGAELPWVTQKLLAVPVKVQKAKEDFMEDVGAALKTLFPKGVPVPLGEYMKYVAKLKHNEEPDYDKCRNWFSAALKQMKIPNTGDLDFKLKPQNSSNNNHSPPSTSKAATAAAAAAATAKRAKKEKVASPDYISASEEEEESPRKKPQVKASPAPRRNAKDTPTISPRKRNAAASIPAEISPSLKRVKTEPNDTPKPRATPRASPRARGTPRSAASPKARTPNAASANINFSPAISLRSKHGKTVVNDDLTPKPRSNKTYEFNFELDVSMDANVIVNVKRKKKAAAKEQPSGEGDARTPSARSLASSKEDTPVTRVNLRKVNGEGASDSPLAASSSSNGRSPRTPAVTVRKYRR